MADIKRTGSTKRFGARYGRRLRQKLGEIESVQRGEHKCPYCHSTKVKRKSAGIWLCNRCNSKFTGRAYSLQKTILAGEKELEEREEIPEKEENISEEKEEDSEKGKVYKENSIKSNE